jgi:hypothetical protein
MKDTDVPLLLDALRGDGNRREAAIARLIIVGKRAIGGLVETYQGTSDRALQIAILRILEASGDGRVLGVVQHAIDGGGDLAIAGIAVLRELLGRRQGSTEAEALDLLLAITRDRSAERRVRAAALLALDNAPADVRKALGAFGPDQSADDALWEDARAGHLPDRPDGLRESIAGRAATAPLADLRRLIEAVSAREAQASSPAAAREWVALRGAIHQALALRGSRIALYDLRDTFARAAAALPSSFLGAAQLAGDESCLEPLAAAFARSGDDRWRHQLAQAFHEIVKRERITKRHSALRRALARAPGIADGGPRTADGRR